MATQVEPEVARRRFTADDLLRMGEAGILGERERVELIEGEIVEMSPIGEPHARCVDRLAAFLIRRLPDEVMVRVQGPVRLSEITEPLPDLAVIVEDRDTTARPWSVHTPLVIEVAVTSLSYDRDVKVPLYARHGHSEVWIVDVTGATVERYSEPAETGYRRVDRFGGGDVVESRALPGLSVSVDEMLG